MIGATNSLFVVLNDNERVSVASQSCQRVEQYLVVAGMQANGRFVEHIADALQVGTQLRGEPDTLCLSSGERRRRAIQLQVAQSHALQELQARTDFGEQVASNLFLAGAQLELNEEVTEFRHGPTGERRNGLVPEANVQRDRAQSAAFACAARDGLMLVPLVPPDLFAALLLVKARHLHARPVAALTPAVLGVK